MHVQAAPEAESVDQIPSPARRKRWSASTWLVLIPSAVVLVFFAYPLLKVFQLSFTDFLSTKHGTWDNYTWFLKDETQRTILARTVRVSLLVTLICAVVSYPYAYAMTLVGPKTRLLMLGAVLLPFWSSLLVRLYAWVIVLQPSGPLNSVLQHLGLPEVQLLGTTTAVTLGSVHILLPFFVLPLYANLTRIDRRLLDAAISLGARPVVAFVRVYLPLSVPGLLAGCTIVFIFMMGFYFTPAFLGSTRHSLVSGQIVTQVNQLLAFGRSGAMAFVLLVLTFALLGIAALISRPLRKALSQGGPLE